MPLAAMALVLGLVAPLASLPLFALGYWDKAEPIIVMLHAAGAAAALGLALAARAAPGLVRACIIHPFVLLPTALAGWSALAAPFVALPLLSLSGTIQSGLGVFWHLDIALLIAAARLVRTDAVLWRRVRLFAVAAVETVTAIKGFDRAREQWGGAHLLIWVASYYAWLGLALPAVAYIGRDGRKTVLAILTVAAAAVLCGRTITAVAAAGLFLLLRRRQASWVKLGGAALIMAAATLPGFLVAFFKPLAVSASMADRRSLLAMIWDELTTGPWSTWLIGLGWGRTQDTFQAHLGASGQRLWDDSWIFMSSDYFNAHNFLMEAMLAAGLPGLALTLAGVMILPLACAPERRAAAVGFGVALTLMSSMWFPLGLSLPLTAMALAAISPAPVIHRTAWRGATPTLLGLAAMLTILTVGLIVHGREVAVARLDLEAGAAFPRPIPADPRGGDLVAAEMIRDAFNRMDRINPPEHERFRPTARAMIAHLSRRIPETPTVLLCVTGMSLMAQVRVGKTLDWLESELPDLDSTWDRWLDRTLTLAPTRTDLAIPRMSDLLAQGRIRTMETRVRSILARDPVDPIGLYFLGIVEILKPDPAAKARGLDRLRAAANHGIERFMPLDPSLKLLLTR